MTFTPRSRGCQDELESPRTEERFHFFHGPTENSRKAARLKYTALRLMSHYSGHFTSAAEYAGLSRQPLRTNDIFWPGIADAATVIAYRELYYR